MSTGRNLFRTSTNMFIAPNVGRRRASHDRDTIKERGLCALLTSLGPRLIQDAIAAETAADAYAACVAAEPTVTDL